MHRFVFLVLPLLLIISHKIEAQVDGSRNAVFSGIIVDDSLAYPLPSVHLWNESTRMGGISNESGEFGIHVGSQDTVVFSAIGYESLVIVIPASVNQNTVVRLKSKAYEIDELVVRRFRSYESFKYQVVHLDLPESETAELQEYINLTSTAVALEADRERAIKDKLETGRFGYITPLGKGIDREKAFREKIYNLEKRERIINAKFNRKLVADITQLGGDELSEFIALCNFSDDYLYESDLYTIIEALHLRFNEYQNLRDTIPYLNEHQEYYRGNRNLCQLYVA